MREPLWERLKQRVCKMVGHRERYSAVSRAASCARCRRLLWTDYERGVR